MQAAVAEIDAVERYPEGDAGGSGPIAAEGIVVRPGSLRTLWLLQPCHVVGREIVLDEVLHERDVPAVFQVVAVPGVVDVHPLDCPGLLPVAYRTLYLGVIPMQVVPHF